MEFRQEIIGLGIRYLAQFFKKIINFNPYSQFLRAKNFLMSYFFLIVLVVKVAQTGLKN